ncbi:hypothetical protein FISHEDRAFT_70852 [Fistulina hepatica ATCC 64428]|uniref:Uncharacterized protein n=1 Tax=Fistulina hepatica ATCC 64428 TaxID=1128425 RepID=A0A0D7AHJ3_9AGAR|nr:hypothetical protein FISHEDRAFT_70852 [Fistulina hepatica ATCC 64428]
MKFFAFTSIAAIAAAAIHVVAASSVLGALSPHAKRAVTNQIPTACYDGGAPCVCPIDNNGDTGVLINYYPGYQCAYAGGACTWNDNSGALQNTAQTNCPTWAPCHESVCECPIDNNGDSGVLINDFSGYQCAYTGGACTWSLDGVLQNTAQTNCPEYEKCRSA